MGGGPHYLNLRKAASPCGLAGHQATISMRCVFKQNQAQGH